MIHSAWGMLKPGGTLYIKDLFVKEAAVESLEDDIKREGRREWIDKPLD